MKGRIPVYKTLAIIGLLLYWVAVMLGVLRFNLWSQVVGLWESDASWLNVLQTVHGPRYMLVLPVFLLGHWTGMDVDAVFSIYAAGAITVSGFIIARAATMYRGVGTGLWRCRFLACGSLMLLSLFMNGRITLALLGMAILLASFIEYELRLPNKLAFWARVIVGLVFSSVSTGTALAATLTLALWVVVRLARELLSRNLVISSRFIWLGIGLVALMALIGPLVWSFFYKNYSYYNNSVYEMLGHGYGIILINIPTIPAMLILLLLALVGVLAGTLIVLCSGRARVPLIGIFTGSMAGLFGYSTLAMAIPAFLILVLGHSHRVLSARPTWHAGGSGTPGDEVDHAR